ncbi:hypothetical protein FSPOR_2757 [Fusarium sporotrichioides]|uniref:Uncharacterized protein n=1 Tax=Fusarium sporotrichioides TaxID=5514 RepID=A0A395SIK0_FUSSP|nr:hypothetical protein FSPOR_2757 [Fusarium sporotrichioides]
MMHCSFVLVAALAGHAAATPCPPKWMIDSRSSWISASTRLDSVLSGMPTMYPGGLTAPPSAAAAAAKATATTTGAGNKAAGTSSATVGLDEVSSTEASDSSTTLASPSVASGDSTSDSSASSTEDVSVTRTTTTITITPTVVDATSASDTASASDASLASGAILASGTTSITTTSGKDDTEEDSSLDRRDGNTDKPEEQTDEDETLETRIQQATLKLKEAYELQELFNIAVLKWGKAEAEVKRRVRAAVDFAHEVQADTEALEDEDEKEKTEGEENKEEEKSNKVDKRDKINGCGCGNKNEKRQDRVDQDLEHEKQEYELYAGIGKQLELSLDQKDEQADSNDHKAVYLITKQFKVYKCLKPKGCELYNVHQVDGLGHDGEWSNNYEHMKKYKDSLSEAKEYYKEDFEKNVKDKIENNKSGEQTTTSFFEIEEPEKEEGPEKKKEEKVEEEKKEEVKEQADSGSPLLAGGDEKKQYERISALYMQYRSMIVEPIRRDLDPILRNSKYKEDKEMAAQYREGNEKEQRQRLSRLYMDYRYMLVPKWQDKLDPILWSY